MAAPDFFYQGLFFASRLICAFNLFYVFTLPNMKTISW